MTLPVQRRATKVSTSLVTISFKERCILHQSAAAVNMTELLHLVPTEILMTAIVQVINQQTWQVSYINLR